MVAQHEEWLSPVRKEDCRRGRQLRRKSITLETKTLQTVMRNVDGYLKSNK